MVLYGTGDYERIDTADDLKFYMEDFHDATNQHQSLRTCSRNGKYLVLYKQSSGLFPIYDKISCRDWTQISDTAPAPPPVVAPVAPVAAPAPDLS